MTLFAHVGGLPLEELLPAVGGVGGLVVVRTWLRSVARRWAAGRRRSRRPSKLH